MITATRDAQSILVNIGEVQIRFPNSPKTEQTVSRLQSTIQSMQEDVLKKGIEHGVGIGIEISNVMSSLFSRESEAGETPNKEPETTIIMPFHLHDQLSNVKLSQISKNRATYAVSDANNTVIGVLEFNSEAETAFVFQLSTGMGNAPFSIGIDVNPDNLETLISGLQQVGINSVKAK